MFNVFSRARTRDQSIRQALAQAGLPAATDRARVVLVRKPGQYSGRRVDFFHVFDPMREDVHLASGHVEQNGAVVINGWPKPAENGPVRVPANRAEHADDERLVFLDANTSQVSEVGLSAPAPSQLHPTERRQ